MLRRESNCQFWVSKFGIRFLAADILLRLMPDADTYRHHLSAKFTPMLRDRQYRIKVCGATAILKTCSKAARKTTSADVSGMAPFGSLRGSLLIGLQSAMSSRQPSAEDCCRLLQSLVPFLFHREVVFFWVHEIRDPHSESFR